MKNTTNDGIETNRLCCEISNTLAWTTQLRQLRVMNDSISLNKSMFSTSLMVAPGSQTAIPS